MHSKIMETKSISSVLGWPTRKVAGTFKPSHESVLFVNFRSALYCLANKLNSKKVWLPSYMCESVINSIDNPRFYKIGKNFNYTGNELRYCKPNDLIVAVDFFGFPFDKRILETAKKQRALVVEDLSMSCFSKSNNDSDFILYSLTKSMGISDGAVLEQNTKSKISFDLQKPPNDFIETSMIARLLRSQNYNFSPLNWHKWFVEGKKKNPLGFFSISEESKMAMHTIDKLKILENFNRYKKSFKHEFTIEKNIIPSCYPILVNQRDQVQKELYKFGIYCSIQWPLLSIAKKYIESHIISKSILCLPCGDNCSKDEIDYVSSNLLKIANKMKLKINFHRDSW